MVTRETVEIKELLKNKAEIIEVVKSLMFMILLGPEQIPNEFTKY